MTRGSQNGTDRLLRGRPQCRHVGLVRQLSAGRRREAVPAAAQAAHGAAARALRQPPAPPPPRQLRLQPPLQGLHRGPLLSQGLLPRLSSSVSPSSPSAGALTVSLDAVPLTIRTWCTSY